MGLRAAGVAAGSVHRSGGRTATAYLTAHAGSWQNAYDLERGILAVVADRPQPGELRRPQPGVGAAGEDRRQGPDRLRPRTRPTGACSRCAPPDAGVPASTLRYIGNRQHRNGGYGMVAGGGARLERHRRRGARAARGRRRVRRPARSRTPTAISRTAQASSHGYGLLPGAAADSQSTSWVIQARHACGLRNQPLAGLAGRPRAPKRRLQLPAGHHDHAGVRHRPGAPGAARPLLPDPVNITGPGPGIHRSQTATPTTR